MQCAVPSMPSRQAFCPGSLHPGASGQGRASVLWAYSRESCPSPELLSAQGAAQAEPSWVYSRPAAPGSAAWERSSLLSCRLFWEGRDAAPGAAGGCSRKLGLPSWVCSMWGCLSGLPKHFPNTLIIVIYRAKVWGRELGKGISRFVPRALIRGR